MVAFFFEKIYFLIEIVLIFLIQVIILKLIIINRLVKWVKGGMK